MAQSQIIKLPSPLHAQLKALAAVRGTTMVGVVHSTIRQAIEAGELPDETPGLKVALVLDLDGEDHGPFVVINTPKGELPYMTKEDAEAVAIVLETLGSLDPRGSDVVHNRLAKGGQIAVGFRGTGIEIEGALWGDEKNTVRVIVTAALAGDLARQIRTAATGAVHEVE